MVQMVVFECDQMWLSRLRLQGYERCKIYIPDYLRFQQSTLEGRRIALLIQEGMSMC